MTMIKLIIRSILYYWKTSLGIFGAVLVSAAVLTGALGVGDCVRGSLSRLINLRLGNTDFAMVTGDRFFNTSLADRISERLSVKTCAILNVPGMISRPDGTKRINRAQVVGVDDAFFDMAGALNPFNSQGEGLVLSTQAATKLAVKTGDEIVLTIAKPSLMPRDIPLVSDSDLSVAFRLTILDIISDEQFGRFSLTADQTAPMNIFVPADWLGEKIQQNGLANILLLGDAEKKLTIEQANNFIKDFVSLEDLQLQLTEMSNGFIELTSRRTFIDDFLADSAIKAGTDTNGILTYFINEFCCGDKATPYSMLAAVDKSDQPDGLIPQDMTDDQIIINEWLADDIGADEGDEVKVSYFVISDGRKLIEKTNNFTVKAVLPMMGPGADASYTPDFEGLTDVDNCRDWDSGIPIDLDKIRTKDEDYWDRYGPAPKAFITLSAGQKLWANRFGNLTAVRYPADRNTIADIRSNILTGVDPAQAGLFFTDVRSSALKAQSEGTDFGQLFLGLSMFLIASAVVLTLLVFIFGIEKRAAQIGLITAVGFPAQKIKTLLFFEGGFIALMGSVVGSLAGTGYTKLMLTGLGGAWSGAVAGSAIEYYITGKSMLTGIIGALAISIFGMWISLRILLKRQANELLAGIVEKPYKSKVIKTRISLAVAAMTFAGAVFIMFSSADTQSKSAAGAFFGAGALLLITGFAAFYSVLMATSSGPLAAAASLMRLSLTNASRRTGRSMAVVTMLACGCFMVIAVGANKHDPTADVNKINSGTGGFTLIGDSAIAIVNDLDSRRYRNSIGLDDKVFEDVKIVSLRLHDGDDASCLNLNRAQQPKILGVKVDQFTERNCFFFKSIAEGFAPGWSCLKEDLGDNVVPAVGDYATVYWALGKNVGDQVHYVDDKGRIFKLHIVGMLENSVLQGSLIISDENFIERFPSDEGYRTFLIDMAGDVETLSEILSFALIDFGVDLESTADRLMRFSTVEHTYLSIFQLLGGLGLVLGSIGLGFVVLLNVLQRRGELAMMRAVGFDKESIRNMIVYEHVFLTAAGLLFGTVAAIIAVWPVLMTSGGDVPYFSLLLTVLAIAASALIWIWAGTAISVSGSVLDGLRTE